MARTKGTAMVALKQFVQERFGQAGWSRLLDSLPAEERIQVELPSTIAWYELSLFQQALHGLVELLGQGDATLAREFGRYEAERDLTTVQRIFLRMANPALVMEKAGQYWHRFADFGEWNIQRDDHHAAVATLEGCPRPDVLYCAELTGYLSRMLELVGARHVRVRHPSCRARGDARCLWKGNWG